jgi:hypothetical protein
MSSSKVWMAFVAESIPVVQSQNITKYLLNWISEHENKMNIMSCRRAFSKKNKCFNERLLLTFFLQRAEIPLRERFSWERLSFLSVYRCTVRFKCFSPKSPRKITLPFLESESPILCVCKVCCALWAMDAQSIQTFSKDRKHLAWIFIFFLWYHKTKTDTDKDIELTLSMSSVFPGLCSFLVSRDANVDPKQATCAWLRCCLVRFD